MLLLFLRQEGGPSQAKKNQALETSVVAPPLPHPARRPGKTLHRSKQNAFPPAKKKNPRAPPFAKSREAHVVLNRQGEFPDRVGVQPIAPGLTWAICFCQRPSEGFLDTGLALFSEAVTLWRLKQGSIPFPPLSEVFSQFVRLPKKHIHVHPSRGLPARMRWPARSRSPAAVPVKRAALEVHSLQGPVHPQGLRQLHARGLELQNKKPARPTRFFFFGGGEPVVRGSLNIFQTRKHRRKINAHLSWAKKVRCLSDLVGFLGQVMKVILKPSMSQTETSPAAKPSGDWSWIASDSPCGCSCSQEHLANTKSSQKHKLAQPLFVCKQCTILHWPLPQTRAFAGARIGDNARAMLQHSNKEFKLRPVLYVFYV